MEILFVFLLAAATRGLWQQTRRDLARWRHRPPRTRSGPGWWRRLTAGGTGYYGHQALHGFPTARHGLVDGWMRGREAHHRAQRAIAQARAEHAEGKAELRPQLEAYRERRRQALQDLWEQQRHRPEEAAEPEAPEAGPAAEPEAGPAAGPEVRQCYEHGNPLPCGLCSRDDSLPEPAGGPRYEHAHCTGCGAWYAAGHRRGCWVGAAEAAEQEPDEDEAAEQEPEGDHDWEHYPPDDEPEPEQAPGTDENKGDETVSETTYQGVKARMTAAQAAAEQRQAEASATQDGTEERVEEAQAAQAYAETTGEEMQALEVDSAVLGAMAEHQDALRRTVEAEQELQEAATAVNTAWQDVVETAGQVSGQLEASGHGAVQEARDNAAAGGGKKEWYGEG